MTKNEKQKIMEIISLYAKCHDSIEKLEKEITNLGKRKEQLISELKQIRNNEQVVVEELKTKYGEDAVLNLQKMEITNGKT